MNERNVALALLLQPAQFVCATAILLASANDLRAGAFLLLQDLHMQLGFASAIMLTVTALYVWRRGRESNPVNRWVVVGVGGLTFALCYGYIFVITAAISCVTSLRWALQHAGNGKGI